MADHDNRIENLIRELKEREKELNCLYRIEGVLANASGDLEELLRQVVEVLPSGWQYPELCQAQIEYEGQTFRSSGYVESPIRQSADLIVQDKPVGRLLVSYRGGVPKGKGGYFLPEEERLLRTVADRLGHAILYLELKRRYCKWDGIGIRTGDRKRESDREEWRAIVDTLRKTDRKLYIYLARKMLRQLCRAGNARAVNLLRDFGYNEPLLDQQQAEDQNRPSQKQSMEKILALSESVFQIAAEHMKGEEIVVSIERWLREERAMFFVRAIDDPNSTLNDVINAISRFRLSSAADVELSPANYKGVLVSLIRRLFYEQLEFINVAKQYVTLNDIFALTDRIIYHEDSYGHLGGKSAGLFLAERIIRRLEGQHPLLRGVRTPRTWYVTSDSLTHFLNYNGLEDIHEQKYKDLEEIRFEYPNLVQIFKHSSFPPRIVSELSAVLDEIGERPIVVRSSSLLEDRAGAVFSGKYKSLFLANRGSKKERLEALTDAIAEVYASTFAPDPIEYRIEHGLLDFFEEMGIMIQEVVGNQVGDYFLPTFAGVAFSHNEFSWSPRIRREDGIIRMTPGLGTRAVDRVADDYPTLIAPGKPELRVNTTPEEIVRYSTRRVDVINLRTKTFQTVDFAQLVRDYGEQIPKLEWVISVYDGQMLRHPSSLFSVDLKKDHVVATFEGLLRTDFVATIRTMLEVLRESFGMPVDIEFAHDGEHLYLLQCRPQSRSRGATPVPIPKNVSKDQLLFTANRYVTNGLVPDITHIVYVDPAAYDALSDQAQLLAVGRIVGLLNKQLPRRHFILMGPGRWGSRGDIKLGVSVTYSDINRSAMLIEIARRKGNYVPELSFGTHFFQDLVESSIRYLPLYPDDDGVFFNEDFLRSAENQLQALLPEYRRFADVVRVIDVPCATRGKVLEVLMNADEDRAVGLFVEAGEDPQSACR
ncbi:MAG: PEP/pyruvate-binding domain-containing protein [Candidatus Oleimicrobiaceae bacterium]